MKLLSILSIVYSIAFVGTVYADDDVKRIQVGLQGLGYYDREIDGEWNYSLDRAIQKFELDIKFINLYYPGTFEEEGIGLLFPIYIGCKLPEETLESANLLYSTDFYIELCFKFASSKYRLDTDREFSDLYAGFITPGRKLFLACGDRLSKAEFIDIFRSSAQSSRTLDYYPYEKHFMTALRLALDPARDDTWCAIVENASGTEKEDAVRNAVFKFAHSMTPEISELEKKHGSQLYPQE